ncbi:SdpI family protein [Ruminococcus albus]|uniref:Uncharacterized membrane protein n=1 Tax=Ruminococcus albus TaxID=1264 RepID=A0A1I1MVR9_RUMAL|nr:DUF1648 domain-containing protein [Ruminococcus albus]SFC88982.1 Uncharacterized membrane protein [Ruminococcus albus]
MKKLTWGIALFPLIATAAAVNFLPEKVPTHYNAAGEIDNWGSRNSAFLLPIFIIIFTAIFEAIAQGMKRRAGDGENSADRAKQNIKVLQKIVPWVIGAMGAFHLVMLVKMCADGHADISNMPIDDMRIYAFILGLIFIPIGNSVSKTRRNGLVGFRLKWTLYNDVTWQRSNLFGGVCLMLVGVCTMISAAFMSGLAAILLMLAYLNVALVVMMVYAKRVYDEEKGKAESSGAEVKDQAKRF